MEYELGWKAVLRVKVAFQMRKSDDRRRGTLWAVALKLETEMAPACLREYQEQPLSSAVGTTGWGKKSFAW